MIPIIVGPQGPGYTNIYIDSNNHIVQVTTPPITGVNLGVLNCYTGPTGPTGGTGPMNPTTGPTSTEIITGATGTELDALLYDPTTCQFRFIYNNNTFNDSDSLTCKQLPIGLTGSTGPTGANVQYVLLFSCGGNSGSTIETVYSNNTSITADICCVCPSLTGYTGIQGIITSIGGTGPTGSPGINTQFGAIGPTGPTGILSTVPMLSTNMIGPQGPKGNFVYNTIAYIELIEPIQFYVNSNNSVVRKGCISTNQRSDILFPDTPLNLSWSTQSYHANFTALVDGLQVNNNCLVRIRTEWISNNDYNKPYGVLNYTIANNFPTLLTSSYPYLTKTTDMICSLSEGDIINIFPGTLSKYPVSQNQVFYMNFTKIKFIITTLYNY